MTRSRAVLLLSVLLCLGGALGFAWVRARSPTSVGPTERLAISLVNAAADLDLAWIWRNLDPATIAGFERGHAVVVESAAWHEERGRDPAATEVIRVGIAYTEKAYGLTLAEIRKTTTYDLWANQMRRELGTPEMREPLRLGRPTESTEDGVRARVQLTLSDGRVQGFHFVRIEGLWKLVDFRPYWGLDRWPLASSTAARDASPPAQKR